MGQAEIELVKRLLAAWNDRDVETARAIGHPEMEYVNDPSAVEPGTRHGIAAFVEVAKAQWDLLGPDAHQEIEHLHDRGDEVISETRLSRTMPDSEARIQDRMLISWRFRGGKVFRLEILGAGSEFDAARKAAGLEGGPGTR